MLEDDNKNKVLSDSDIYLEWLNTSPTGDQKKMIIEFARRIENKILTMIK